MKNEDFERMATLYLEGVIDDYDLERLNHELANFPNRIREFNDLRLLAGIIHEHGRPAPEDAIDVIAEKPSQKKPARKSIILPVLAGLLAGCLSTGATLALAAPDFGKFTQIIHLEVGNNSFEKETAPPQVGGDTATASVWFGDPAEIVESGDQGVFSYDGTKMLKVGHTWYGEVPESNHKRADLWQIVNLEYLDLKGSFALATLQARLNRIDAGSKTDYVFRMEMYSFKGGVSTAKAQLDAQTYLSSSQVRHRIDADVKTWELKEAIASIPNDADFLLIGINAIENVQNDQPTEIEFAGHYVDGIELFLTFKDQKSK